MFYKRKLVDFQIGNNAKTLYKILILKQFRILQRLLSKFRENRFELYWGQFMFELEIFSLIELLTPELELGEQTKRCNFEKSPKINEISVDSHYVTPINYLFVRRVLVKCIDRCFVAILNKNMDLTPF